MPVWFLTSIPEPCSSPLLWYETWIFLISIVFALINEDSVPETLHHCAHLSSGDAWLVLRGYKAQNSSSLPADITLCFMLTHCGAVETTALWLTARSLWWPFWFLFSWLSVVLFLSSASSHRKKQMLVASHRSSWCWSLLVLYTFDQPILILFFMGLAGHLVWLCMIIRGLDFCYVALLSVCV